VVTPSRETLIVFFVRRGRLLALLRGLGNPVSRAGAERPVLQNSSLKIVNCMFGPDLGGLEQVFVDYSEVLAARGHEVLNLVAPRAKVITPLTALGLPFWEAQNFNQYDFLAIARIRRRVRQEKPDVVIAHGNRAINLVKPAVKGLAPFIAVNHSVNVRSTVGADFAIAINDDMRARLVAAGQPPARVFKLFNMVRPPPDLPAPAPLRSPPVITAMGRFVAKKGFEVFIEALGKLKDEGVAFKAVLAGSGELEAALKATAGARGLDELLQFPGWVTDKAAFFAATDIFCFTSSHDVCPVVLLEAFLYAKPVILTDCPGPREISNDGVDSLLFPIDDAGALAAKIRELIDNPARAHALAGAAQRKILETHTFERAGAKLEEIARGVVERWTPPDNVRGRRQTAR
jgi:glycosyltransferase involved in cell wall biosynthesis